MHMARRLLCFFFFFFNDTATTEIYTLSLHDALPICRSPCVMSFAAAASTWHKARWKDRKSTRLNSSHDQISYAVFCLKKKKKHTISLTLKHTHNITHQSHQH